MPHHGDQNQLTQQMIPDIYVFFALKMAKVTHTYCKHSNIAEEYKSKTTPPQPEFSIDSFRTLNIYIINNT